MPNPTPQVGGVVRATTKGISPKAVAAVVAAIVSYLLTQTVLDLPDGVVLALNALAVAIAAAGAGLGKVVVKSTDPGDQA